MKIDIGQLEFIDKTARAIVTDLETETGLEFTVTSLYRIGDGGVHGALPVRGVDLRMRNFIIGRSIVALVNSRWRYDPQRINMVCAVLHGEDSHMHIHIQSHPNTLRLNTPY